MLARADAEAEAAGRQDLRLDHRKERSVPSVTSRSFTIASSIRLTAPSSSLPKTLPILSPDLLQPRSFHGHLIRNHLREVANHEHISPARSGIAAARITVVLREEHDSLELGELRQDLEGAARMLRLCSVRSLRHVL